MPPLFHLPDEMFKKMNIGRVIDIDNNSHGQGCSIKKRLLFCAVNGQVFSIVSFSPVNHKK